MGNTPSHEGNGSSSPSPGAGQASNNNASGSTPSTAQPIPTNANHTISSMPLGSGFHSGLTPPQRTPSPPPPSTPPLLPYGGHLSPQNPHALTLPQAKDYSKTIVTRLVMEARLAPFYRGLEDYEEDSTEEDIAKMLDEIREKDYEENVPNSVVEQMKFDREGPSKVGQQVVKKIGIHKARDTKNAEEREEAYRREKRAYIGSIECPICFLSYPPNINTTRCCQQPICSECFVQIKRSEPSLTHLESEPASCPFCVETDFGVIYERPPLPTPASSTSVIASPASPIGGSALSVSPGSPETHMDGLSHALTSNREEAELNIGIGMNPKAQETIRRKSVSSKAKEVVTIDEIRPDWEMKLNAVKAAAARKAARRVVMRQVGDRLIPIGYTSARAPGTADFSMSLPPSGQQSGSGSGSNTPSRRERRRTGSRGRDLEELMIMEAMRLSLIDHEEHQRRQDDEIRRGSSPNPTGSAIIIQSNPQSRRVSDGALHPTHGRSTASKLFSKIGGRSRAGSTASSLKAVTFSPSNPNLPGPSRAPGIGGSLTPTERRSSTPPAPTAIPGSAASGSALSTSASSIASPTMMPTTAAMPSSPLSSTQNNSAALSRSPPKSLSPSAPAPVAPITTLANAGAGSGAGTEEISPTATGTTTTTKAAGKAIPPAPQPINLPTPTVTTNPLALEDPPVIKEPESKTVPPAVPTSKDEPTPTNPPAPLPKDEPSSSSSAVPIASAPAPVKKAETEPGLPRISLDMPTLEPAHVEGLPGQSQSATTSRPAEPTTVESPLVAENNSVDIKNGASIKEREVAGVGSRPIPERAETGFSTMTVESERAYAALESGDEE